MIPVSQSQLASLFSEPYKKWLSQANLEGRTTVEGFLKALNEGYDARSVSCFVDSFDEPTVFLALGFMRSVILDKPTCAIYFLEGTGDKSAAFTTAKAFGELHGCGDVAMATWTYLSSGLMIPETLEDFFDSQEVISTHLI